MTPAHTYILIAWCCGCTPSVSNPLALHSWPCFAQLALGIFHKRSLKINYTVIYGTALKNIKRIKPGGTHMLRHTGIRQNVFVLFCFVFVFCKKSLSMGPIFHKKLVLLFTKIPKYVYMIFVKKLPLNTSYGSELLAAHPQPIQI